MSQRHFGPIIPFSDFLIGFYALVKYHKDRGENYVALKTPSFHVNVPLKSDIIFLSRVLILNMEQMQSLITLLCCKDSFKCAILTIESAMHPRVAFCV